MTIPGLIIIMEPYTILRLVFVAVAAAAAAAAAAAVFIVFITSVVQLWLSDVLC